MQHIIKHGIKTNIKDGPGIRFDQKSSLFDVRYSAADIKFSIQPQIWTGYPAILGITMDFLFFRISGLWSQA